MSPMNARQRRADRLVGRPDVAGRGDLALAVVGRARFAEAQGEAVFLAAVHDERDGLGRLAQGDRQDAGRQRIERAAMARLLGGEQPAHLADRLGRAHARAACRARPSRRPCSSAASCRRTRVPSSLMSATEWPAPLRLTCPRCRAPRRDGAAGRRSCRPRRRCVSSWKRISGALRRPAFSPTRARNHGAARRRAASSRVAVLAAQRHDEGRGVAQVGADIDRRHGDRGIAQLGIAHVAALEELGQQMADLLADAQLALAVAAMLCLCQKSDAGAWRFSLFLAGQRSGGRRHLPSRNARGGSLVTASA